MTQNSLPFLVDIYIKRDVTAVVLNFVDRLYKYVKYKKSFSWKQASHVKLHLSTGNKNKIENTWKITVVTFSSVIYFSKIIIESIMF